jgi:ABC-2 type transport system permease protein
MGAAWIIALKDLKQQLRDRSAYVIGIIAPLGMAMVFGFLLNPISDFQLDARFAVVNLDGGPVAQTFIDGVLAGAQGVEVVLVGTVAEAQALAEADVTPLGSEGGDQVDAAFVLPVGFSDNVQSERPAQLDVITNASSTTGAGFAVSLAQTFASDLTSVRVAVASAEALSGEQLDRFNAGLAVLATPSPIQLVDETAATKQLDAKTFYAAGMAIFFLFFTVQTGVTGLLEERNQGTLTRLLSSPIASWTVLVGKLLSSFVVGIVSMLILMIVTTVTVDADWGPPIGVAVLVLAAVVAALGITSLVAAFSRTSEQASSLGSIIAILLGFLGGTFFDVSQAGGLISQLRFVSPHGWFMQGLADLSAGDLGVVVVPALAMTAFGVVTGAIGVARLNRSLQP